MGLFSSLFPSAAAGSDLQTEDRSQDAGVEDERKMRVDAPVAEVYSSDGESIGSGYEGVKKAQATTIVWTRNALIVAYALYVATPDRH